MSFPTHSKAGKGGGGSDRYWLGIHPIGESFWWEDLWVFGAGVYQARGPQEWWGVRGAGAGGGGRKKGEGRERGPLLVSILQNRVGLQHGRSIALGLPSELCPFQGAAVHATRKQYSCQS